MQSALADPAPWPPPPAADAPADPASWPPPPAAPEAPAATEDDAAAAHTPWLPTQAPAESSWRARVAAGDARRPPARPGRLEIAPRARTGSTFVDLAVYDDALQMVPIRGAAPEVLGAIIGFFTVSTLLGWYIGSLLANRSNPERLAELRRARPTPRTLPGDRSGPIAYGEVTDAQLQRTLFSTRLRLRLRDGVKTQLVWPNRQLLGVDLEGALAAGLRSTLRVKPVTMARKVVDGLGMLVLAVLAVMVTVNLILAVFGSGSGGGQPSASTQQEAPAGPGYAEAQAACRGLVRYERWMEVRETTVEEDAAATDAFAAGMAAAAQQDPVFAPAAAAGREMAMLIRTPEQYGSDYDQQVDARLAVINAACTRAG